MGLCAVLTTVSDQNIERIRSVPELLEQLLEAADVDRDQGARQFESAPPRPDKPGFWARLFGKRGAAHSAPRDGHTAELELSEAEALSLDLDKTWHGLHYLLTQTEWEGAPPLNFLVGGGSSLGEDYADQGPPRLFSAAETHAVHEALSALSDEQLAARFAPADMMKKSIYPSIWDRDPADDDTLGYLLESLGPLRQFLQDASERGLGMLITVG